MYFLKESEYFKMLNNSINKQKQTNHNNIIIEDSLLYPNTRQNKKVNNQFIGACQALADQTCGFPYLPYKYWLVFSENKSSHSMTWVTHSTDWVTAIYNFVSLFLSLVNWPWGRHWETSVSLEMDKFPWGKYLHVTILQWWDNWTS